MPDLPGLPAELVEWHRQFAERQRLAARQLRTFTFTCRRCGESFAIQKRGWFRAQRPGICPACRDKRQRAYLKEWRARKRSEQALARRSRKCNGCHKPMPDGRGDRQYCSDACRQRAYRERHATRPAARSSRRAAAPKP